MIPGAAVFVALPLGAAGLVYLVRAWRYVALPLAMLSAAALALLLAVMPYEPTGRFLGLGLDPTAPIVVLGRSLTLETDDRSALLFLYLFSAFLLGGGLAVPVPRLFAPAALATLGMLAAALFVQPFVFATAFLEAAAILTVVMLTDPAGDRPPQRGALRFLIFVTFSVPFLLLTGWVLEQFAGSPEDVSLLAQATALLAAGFAILLPVVPFHSWIPAVAQEASPPAASFVFTVVQAAVVFFMLEFLYQFDWLGANPQIYALMRLAGVVMVGLGGAFAFSQRSFGRLMGYAVVADYGAVLLAIGHGSADGLRIGVVLIALRGIALAVWGVGMGVLRAARPGTVGGGFEALRGVGREQPLAAAAVVLGGLSLVGLPFTAGFPGRWALWRLLAADYPQAAVIVLLATVSVGLAYARGLAVLVSKEAPQAAPAAAPEVETPEDGQTEEAEEELEGELLDPEEAGRRAISARLYIALVGVGLTVIIILGLFPQWLLPAMARAAEAFIRASG